MNVGDQQQQQRQQDVMNVVMRTCVDTLPENSPDTGSNACTSSAAFPVRSGEPGGISSLAVAEENDPNKFRIYRLSKHTPSRSTMYYRCTKCESIAKKATGDDDEKHYAPCVKIVHGKLVGNAHPVHYPNCKTVSRPIQQIREMDRTCRDKIKACGDRSQEDANKLGVLMGQKNFGVDVRRDYNLRPTPKRLCCKYGTLGQSASKDGSSEIERLLRFISESAVVSTTSCTDDGSSFYHESEGETLSDYASVIVPEPDGISVRIYNKAGKEGDNEEAFYHCSRCDNLCRKSDSDSVRATLKAENDLIVDVYPAHHPECLPTLLGSLRGLGDDLKNFCVVANHRIIPLKTVTESESSVQHESDESFVAEEPNQQKWNSDINEEMFAPINFGTNSTTCGHNCSCKRLYEENVELYQEMMRNLDEMRALVNELKSVSGSSPGYYIDEGDIVEDDAATNAVYVVDE